METPSCDCCNYQEAAFWTLSIDGVEVGKATFDGPTLEPAEIGFVIPIKSFDCQLLQTPRQQFEMAMLFDEGPEPDGLLWEPPIDPELLGIPFAADHR